MARKNKTFCFAAAASSYKSNLKKAVKLHPELAPLLDDTKEEITYSFNVRQALRDGTIKPLSAGVLSGGGFTETDEERKALEDYEKGKEQEKEKGLHKEDENS